MNQYFTLRISNEPSDVQRMHFPPSRILNLIRSCLFVSFAIITLFSPVILIGAQQWRELKGDHFVVYFISFCHQLRDGKNFLEALEFSYPTSIRSIQALEEKWQIYIKEK